MKFSESLDAEGNEFKCHHGPKECVANVIHSCSIKYLTSQDAKQQFVVCQMRLEADQTGKEVWKNKLLRFFTTFEIVLFLNKHSHLTTFHFQSFKQCLLEAGGNFSTVQKCVNGKEGKQLQLQAEKDTKVISVPRLENVPTIVFNNVCTILHSSHKILTFHASLILNLYSTFFPVGFKFGLK